MSQLSQFSIQQLLQEITARATEAGVTTGAGNTGLFMLLRGVSNSDLDKLSDCEGTSAGEGEVFIFPYEFHDEMKQISPELQASITAAENFGFELIQAYH